MTSPGSQVQWGIASHFGVVPSPPNSNLSHLLLGWWQLPRCFGCVHARAAGEAWQVVAPDPSIDRLRWDRWTRHPRHAPLSHRHEAVARHAEQDRLRAEQRTTQAAARVAEAHHYGFGESGE